MDVILEAIKFNHQPNSATNDGFSIRHNETREVPSPEWRSGLTINSEDSPAAYALDQIQNQTLSIAARVSCSDPNLTSLWVRALDGNIYPERLGTSGILRFALWLFRPVIRAVVEPNVLGVVAAKQILPSSGPDDFRTLELANVRLKDAGVGVNEIIWRWQFSMNGTDWTDIRITRHRIYSVFQLPKGAWKPNSDDPANTQLPWTDVMEYACRWAAGATTDREIADRITTGVNKLGPDFIYYDDISFGSPHYTPNDPPRLDCQRFLNLLNGASEDSKDQNVNCDDCAAIVSSFICVLGYELPVSAMKPVSGPKFFLRSHQKIGFPIFDPIDSFFHHTVAWAGGDEDEVSDACLRLDTNETGLGQPAPLLAGFLPFGRDGEHFYRHFLAVAENCRYTTDSTRFRCIGLSATGCTATDAPIDLELIKKIYEYDKWVKPSEDWPLVEPSLFLKPGQDFSSWKVRSARLVPNDSAEFILSPREGARENVIRIDAQFAKDSIDADDKLLRALGRFEKAGMKYRKDAQVGDNAFADDSGVVILFSRSNLILLIRNLTKKPIVLWTVARFIDEFILGIYR